ncbi:MAG TPA: MBL fold metallo-hydrolase, partial [Chloroflexota bacterium]|nr:MBL fold metallo-hydrolase [Chloroflexota bacterium]
MAEDVYRIVRQPAHVANAYLLGDVLLDAMTRWTGRYILRRLAGHPLSLVALTHVHPDHQGAAAQICLARGVPLACHQADVAAMEGRAPMLRNPLVQLAGRLWAGPPYPVERILRDGDQVAGFRVVHAPGHTPGHSIFFRDADRLAICGDLLNNVHPLTGAVRLQEPPPWVTHDPAQNRR